jgi:hypothetical protein
MPNKESVKQERKDLGKMPGAYKQMDSAMPMKGDVSFMSKHNSAISMMMPKNAKGSSSHMKKDPAGYMKEGAPTMMKGEPKPDFPDIDGDGNKKESMAQAAKDKKNS